jgi:hypothetical protein
MERGPRAASDELVVTSVDVADDEAAAVVYDGPLCCLRLRGEND